MIDRFGRNIDYLRISVIDKCNLRCRYCMPECGIQSLAHEDILSFEEIYRAVKIMTGLGVRKIRLTGGEPLVRKDIVELVRMINSIDCIEDISLTTNGIMLGSMAEELYKAGIRNVNLSLDTKDRERFAYITRRDEFERVYNSLGKAVDTGMNVKINTVITREMNYADAIDMALIAKEYPVSVRFIELMPIGCGADYTGVASEELLAIFEKKFGNYKESDKKHGNGPARYVDFDGFKESIGFISPMSHKFCSECNRVRMTADGKLKLCLHYDYGIDLRRDLRCGMTDEEIRRHIEEAVYDKPRAHTFTEEKQENADKRRMVQIGG